MSVITASQSDIKSLTNLVDLLEVTSDAPTGCPKLRVLGKPRQVVVFDLDGTLSDARKREHHLLKTPKDWTSFFAELGEDDAHEHIAQLAYLIHHFHPFWDVVLATGRDEAHRAKTIQWMKRHGVFYEKLYMRPAGDRRDDSVVKIEMIEQMHADGFEPVMVFEDRARVVNAWRAAGIPCLQVADGNF